MDPITDLFHTMHIASVVHARLEATAPWGLTHEAEEVKRSSASFVCTPEFAIPVMGKTGTRSPVVADREARRIGARTPDLTTVSPNQYAFLLVKMRSKVMVMICRSKVRLQLRR